MRLVERAGPSASLTAGRIVRDAHGLMWRLDAAPRWTGAQLRVRARLLRCAGVWGDLPADALEPRPTDRVGRAFGI
jgi:hypothetical protein